MNEKIIRFLDVIKNRTDLILTILMVSVIFVMILPLPTFIVDILIASNFTLAIILLIVAIYLIKPVNFSTFPSVLLISTLFRLSISITTTRLILLQADAGKIVSTFGNFVVAGNIVVGLVIFSIITIVQFIVITKGAERVAEVSARFSLDAMPGKQMSIDGDLRAGNITITEASYRRVMVEKESQFYGSMDGAMKFVKGDAIAGIIVIIVNLVGGIIIGIFQRGMSFAEAIHTYSILTVGDGLVSQIPGLFISITSGIIVTRVTSDDGLNLGTDIFSQLASNYRIFLISSLVCFCFAFIPGMPSIVFVTIALLLGIVATLSIYQEGGFSSLFSSEKGKKKKQFVRSFSPSQKDDESPAKATEEASFSVTIPLMIDASLSIQELVDEEVLNNELLELRDALYHDLGVPFPGIHLRFDNELKKDNYVILVQEVPVTKGYFLRGHYLVNEMEENLSVLKIPVVKGKEFLPNTKAIWVDIKYEKVLLEAGIQYMNFNKVLSFHLSSVLKRYSEEFIGLQETRFFLDNMEKISVEVAKELQRTLTTEKITSVLKRLVSENVSIRNLKVIFSSMIDWGQREKDPILLTEYIRNSLKRQISYQYTGDQNILPVYLLNSDVEDVVRNSVRHTSSGSYLALDPEISRKIFFNIQKAVGDLATYKRKPVLLTSMDVRRYVRKMIENDFYELPVLSYQELTQEVTIQPLAKIGLD